MESTAPLEIVAEQQLVIDCGGNELSMASTIGNLTMGRGSSLHYVNCHLQAYEFPEEESVANTVHTMSNSSFAMRSCRFVLNLNKQYAPLIVDLQENATFNLGGLVERGGSAAVHIFTAAFDSLIGPEFRYEIYNTTAHCGPDDGLAAEALQLATSNSPDVIMMSPDISGESVGAEVAEVVEAPSRGAGVGGRAAAAVAAAAAAAAVYGPAWL